jgi:hypothetical protein
MLNHKVICEMDIFLGGILKEVDRGMYHKVAA